MPSLVFALKLINLTLLSLTVVLQVEMEMIPCGGNADEEVICISFPDHVPYDAKNAILWYL
jgi:hypothetical protein